MALQEQDRKDIAHQNTNEIAYQIARRRTFAIISHPDAGKTTITEKLLYTAGAIHRAGEVKGKAGTKAATSDWMTMEQERGISITSSVMQFDHRDLRINLLDTPGHKDFSEDTYRTLMAADSAVMLIDVAKGVEAQTRKLYEVCRYRNMPIFTFINKVDREGKVPLELLDEVESTLKMSCYPITWPIGLGDRFKGIYHRHTHQVFLFERVEGHTEAETIQLTDYKDDQLLKYADEDVVLQFREDIEFLDGVLGPLDKEAFLRGEVSPLTWGSARYVYGIKEFLDIFADLAPGPIPRVSEQGVVDPQDKTFSGFVFKIQANMDKKHRDRVAFIRICSGKFERGMKVNHMRLGREVRLSYANQFLARDRETLDEAFAGDIIGINDTGNFQVGDSISSGRNLIFQEMPRFSPEIFGRLRVRDAMKRKQMQKGVQQLCEEGMVQMFIDPVVGPQDPILGVVGELQFEVLLYRLKDEYNVPDVILDREEFTVARWPRDKNGKPTRDLKGGLRIVEDVHHQPVLLLAREWDLNWAQRENPDVVFHTSISAARQ